MTTYIEMTPDETKWQKVKDTGKACVRFFATGRHDSGRAVTDFDDKVIVLSSQDEILRLVETEILPYVGDPESLQIVGLGQAGWDAFQKENAGRYREYSLQEASKILERRRDEALRRKRGL